MRRTQHFVAQLATFSLKQLKWHKTTRKINDHSPLSHPYTLTPKICPFKTRQFPIGYSLEMQYLQYRLNSCLWLDPICKRNSKSLFSELTLFLIWTQYHHTKTGDVHKRDSRSVFTSLIYSNVAIDQIQTDRNSR